MEFFHPALAPFTIALLLMAFIACLEIVGMMFGLGLSGLADGLAPDIDIDADADIEVDLSSPASANPLGLDGPDTPDAGGLGPLSHFLSWLCVGKVPVLVLIVAFLTGFGLSGLVGQNMVKGLSGFYLHGALASAGALFIALPITRHLGLFLARIMPKEETDAVSSRSFVGKVAVIIRGEAKRGLPAEAKLRDVHGTVHYVLVEPDEASDIFTQGREVLLVEQRGAVFRVIANTNHALAGTTLEEG